MSISNDATSVGFVGTSGIDWQGGTAVQSGLQVGGGVALQGVGLKGVGSRLLVQDERRRLHVYLQW